MTKCPMCGMEVENLEEHKRSTHPEASASMTKCPMCGMEVEDLEEHKRNTHPGM